MTDAATANKLRRLKTLSDQIKKEDSLVKGLRERRFRLIEELADDGVPVATIADVGGVTRVTLHQQLKARRERAHG